MAATIRDVAKRAGLSQSTVSRALNQSGYVSADAQRRIDEAVDELGYQPNWLARGLKGQSSRLVGLIVPEIASLYDSLIIQSVSRMLHENSYGMILCINNEDAEVDLGYLKILQEKRVDGIIYTQPLNGKNSKFVRRLVKEGMPIIELNRRCEEDLLDGVLADNIQSAYQITNYLIGLGHRRIGLVMGQTDLTTGEYRYNGYRHALNDANIPLDNELIRIGSFTQEHGEAGIQELLQLPERPTAVLAGSNRILMGILKVLGEQNICIPGDMSVAAFNDTEWLSIWNPPITTVDIATEEMARLSVELLLRRITSSVKETKPRTYLLSTSLIERGSCAMLNS
ncbi:MAG: LacI family DNA-binding transcriptional regulator [Anaerolineaceae bacterium]|nr:LacI family DNA-binding transcriptional regulator [Anaerolineaceae bacterium]